ncbi:serine-rich adhesin for platelets [Coccinella septempunctata]|uniref:serine-rich adhesin for platelets n=1 Tax=Coccinella septempunctata TaxID=41139 RepID=UPI001D08B74C|nr:serine-rich adhesin for platelets [Coccinella septempunctata]
MGNTNVKPHPKPRSKKQLRWKAADRPSPPGKPSLVGENVTTPDVVHICWTKPEKDGGSTVTAYLVEHRRVGTGHWLKSSPQPVATNELVVRDLEPGWRYQFRVRAENAVGLSDPSEISEPYTATLQRSAIAPPKFTQELTDTVALENDKVEFEIHFLGQPSPNICWFKDGFEIFSGNRTRITTISDKSVLTILRATIADEGEIKCTATNKAGHTSTKCKLTIEAPPSITLPKSYQDQDGIIFEIGEAIKMSVTVSGKPTPLIFWSHDGESIQNNDRYETEYNDKIASVKIENALRTDRGEYQIKAVNKLGHDQASFLVTITDKPTPPGKARVLLTSGRSVTLSWSTPKDDGGCQVGNYIIEYYRIGWDVWLKAATTRQQSTMLEDLIEGSKYKFRVKAESPYGVSEPSEESEVVFIPDPKRGIQKPTDLERIESDSRIPLSRRRRANSSPRVSFVLNEDVPVRPDRKKTGKTPEASPRQKRKQYMPLVKNHIGSEPFLNRKFSVPYASKNDSRTSWENSLIPNLQEVAFNRTTTIIKVEKNKSPSPEIIITDADSEKQNEIWKPSGNLRQPEVSPARGPNFFEKSSSNSQKLKSTTTTSTSHLGHSSKKNLKNPNDTLRRLTDNQGSTTSGSRNLAENVTSTMSDQSERVSSGIPNYFKKSPPSSPLYFEKSPSTSPSLFEKSPSRSPDYLEKSPSRSPEQLEKSPLEMWNKFQKSPSRSPTNFQKSLQRSPDPIEKLLSRSQNHFEKSPSRMSDQSDKSTSSNQKHFETSPRRDLDHLGKSPSRSPNLVEKSSSGTPKSLGNPSPSSANSTERRYSLGETLELRKNGHSAPQKTTKSAINDHPPNPLNVDRIRSPLIRQEFSGSSEFMLVLCPEGEQGTRFKKLVNFEETSIPPPLSLSAPELGIEPPELPLLKRWASSTELLTYRLMERLHEAAMNENNVAGEQKTTSAHSKVPTIQVNSEPAAEINPGERLNLTRRLSGVLSNTQLSWANRRHSLKNAENMAGGFGTKLHKFEETEQMRREISDYRRISESDADDKDVRNLEDEWMNEYEESLPSEGESESSSDERKNSSMAIRRNSLDEDEEIYNPRNRMMSATKVYDNQPFEILTVRKDPPNSDIVPKPILKNSQRNQSALMNSKNSVQSTMFESKTAHSAESQNLQNQEQIPQRNRSSSLTVEDELDVSQLKKSPTPGKRRSFSLLPSQGNFIKEAFKNRNQKNAEPSTSKQTAEPAKKVSALANFTSIAGAGFIIPNEMPEKKETEEEAKVVVDFYGDIVKSFGGKSKPTAEFSRSMVSKYDTYEERKISDIKPNSDSLATHNVRSTSPKNSYIDTSKYPAQYSDQNRSSPISNAPVNISQTKDKNVMKELSNLDYSKRNTHVTNVKSFPKEDPPQNVDKAIRQMKNELSETQLSNKTSRYRRERTSSGNRQVDAERTYRGSKRSSRPGSRQTSVGRRRKDASTSPVRFSDDWDSKCSSINSLNQDYYIRASLNSSEASLSRRSLSPPRSRVRGITTQTSFRIEPNSTEVVQQRIDLAKKAEKRMSFLFGYLTDTAMVAVAAWFYVFQNEYLAVPFILIPIYRQLDQKIQTVKEGIKKRLPRWIRRRLEKNS